MPSNKSEYYAIITHMDAQIGRILDSLEESGLADSTYAFTCRSRLGVDTMVCSASRTLRAQHPCSFHRSWLRYSERQTNRSSHSCRRHADAACPCRIGQTQACRISRRFSLARGDKKIPLQGNLRGLFELLTLDHGQGPKIDRLSGRPIMGFMI